METPHQNPLETRQRAEESQLAQPGPEPRLFESVEAMLRFDAGQHPPPPELAHRVAASTAAEPVRRGGGWRRWLGLGA